MQFFVDALHIRRRIAASGELSRQSPQTAKLGAGSAKAAGRCDTKEGVMNPGDNCTICGLSLMAGEPWFLLGEDKWHAAVSVYAWQHETGRASKRGMQGACSATHVEQLVVHWMTVGSMDYPFARAFEKEVVLQPTGIRTEIDADERHLKLLGEIVIDRESVGRALAENPQTLRPLLDALALALEGEVFGAVPKIGVAPTHGHSRRSLHSARLA